MNNTNMLLAAPELWVLAMACVILIVDLFLSEERRGIIHLLALVTLVFAAIITLRADYLDEGLRSATAFNGSFIRDPMGDVLKLFSYIVLAMVYVYAKFCLRQFRMFRADYYTLSLFALLGVMLLISANNLVMVYLGLELISLSSYALVAFDRDSPRGSEAAMKYFVLGSMASGMLLYGMSMIYGATGTLDLALINERVSSASEPIVGDRASAVIDSSRPVRGSTASNTTPSVMATIAKVSEAFGKSGMANRKRP